MLSGLEVLVMKRSRIECSLELTAYGLDCSAIADLTVAAFLN